MTTAVVLHSFRYALDFLRDLVADVQPEQMASQPPGTPNHPAWVIGHLTLVCQMLGGDIGAAPWLPDAWVGRYGPGSVPTPDSTHDDSKDALLRALADAQARLEWAVSRLTPHDLDAPFPHVEYRHVFPTIGHALTQVLVGHTAYHVGQVATWRRAMGLPSIGRSFE